MFIVGFFSTPLPYLLFLFCYLIGFAYFNEAEPTQKNESNGIVIAFDGITSSSYATAIKGDAGVYNWSKHETNCKKQYEKAIPELKTYIQYCTTHSPQFYFYVNNNLSQGYNQETAGRAPPIGLLV